MNTHINSTPEPRSPRLALRTAGLAQLILDGYPNPVFVVDQARNLLYRNSAAGEVLNARAGFSEKAGKLHLGPLGNAQLLRLLATAGSFNDGGARCHGMRISRPKGSRDWLLLVHMLESSPETDSAHYTFLLHAIGRILPRILPIQALTELFGLTNHETRVVKEIMWNGTVQGAADRLSLSSETIRSHLKSAFRKCDVHSKSELLTLLMCLSQFGVS